MLFILLPTVASLSVWTPGDFNFHYAWATVIGYNYFVFEVKACADAHLALSVIPGETTV
jgi:hypothetical protein